LIGTVAGFKSEFWPVFDWIGGRLQIGIRPSDTFLAPAPDAPISLDHRGVAASE